MLQSESLAGGERERERLELYADLLQKLTEVRQRANPARGTCGHAPPAAGGRRPGCGTSGVAPGPRIPCVRAGLHVRPRGFLSVSAAPRAHAAAATARELWADLRRNEGDVAYQVCKRRRGWVGGACR